MTRWDSRARLRPPSAEVQRVLDPRFTVGDFALALAQVADVPCDQCGERGVVRPDTRIVSQEWDDEVDDPMETAQFCEPCGRKLGIVEEGEPW